MHAQFLVPSGSSIPPDILEAILMAQESLNQPRPSQHGDIPELGTTEFNSFLGGLLLSKGLSPNSVAKVLNAIAEETATATRPNPRDGYYPAPSNPYQQQVPVGPYFEPPFSVPPEVRSRQAIAANRTHFYGDPSLRDRIQPDVQRQVFGVRVLEKGSLPPSLPPANPQNA